MMEDLNSRLQHIHRIYEGMEAKIAGMGGLDGFLGLYDRLKIILENLSDTDIDTLTAEIQKTTVLLTGMEQRLHHMKELKRFFATPPSPPRPSPSIS